MLKLYSINMEWPKGFFSDWLLQESNEKILHDMIP
jgi:hypothetical protein